MITALLGILSLPWLFGSTTIQSYVCQAPDIPIIVSPSNGSTVPTGTVQVLGNATASSQVAISVDGTAAVQVAADQFNNFAANTTLSAGKHTIGVRSVNPCGSQTGSSITIRAKTAKTTTGGGSAPGSTGGGGGTTTGSTYTPGNKTVHEHGLTLTIDTPRDHSSTSGVSVFAHGTTSLPATIRIMVNGKEAGRTFVPATSFGMAVPLIVGENTITFTASSASNQATATIHIRRLATAAHTPDNHQTAATPWWRTTPGIITLAAITVVMLGLILWLVH